MVGRAQAAAQEEALISSPKGLLHAAVADARCAAAGPGRPICGRPDGYTIGGSTCALYGHTLPYATSRSLLLLIRWPGWCAWSAVSYGPRNRSVRQWPGPWTLPCGSLALRATTRA